jgi:tetratricopeptide (TPR) repeat protein
MFALACRLPDRDAWSGPGRDGAWLGLALAGTRGALSREWVSQADRFLHQGVGEYRPRALTDPLGRLADVLSPRAHLHLHGEAAAEIMPWLWLAVRSDPNHVEAYVTAAFWMAGEVGRPDLAQSLLEEARRHNPRDYRVPLEQGRLFLRLGDRDRAWTALTVARRLWSVRPSDVDEEQARIDGAEILTYHGLLKEDHGDVPGALADYGEVLAWFPERAGLRARLERLAAGGAAERSASAVWAESLASRRHVCEAEKAGMVEPGHVHGPGCGHEHEHDHPDGQDSAPAPVRAGP